MTFDWDEANRNHVSRHNVTQDEAEYAFQNDPVDLDVQEDDRDGHRFHQIGATASGRILVMISTVRREATRIISAWDAPKQQKDIYLRERTETLWNPRR